MCVYLIIHCIYFLVRHNICLQDLNKPLMTFNEEKVENVWGLPLITYASRGGGGVNTNAYKCVQRGRGGLNMTKSTHCVRRFIKNATISEQGAQAGITTSYEVLYFLFILIYKMKLWK